MTAPYPFKAFVPPIVERGKTFPRIPTVVAAPVLEMAKASIAALLDEIDRKTPPTGNRTIFTPKLIVRDSCARRS